MVWSKDFIILRGELLSTLLDNSPLLSSIFLSYGDILPLIRPKSNGNHNPSYKLIYKNC